MYIDTYVQICIFIHSCICICMYSHKHLHHILGFNTKIIPGFPVTETNEIEALKKVYYEAPSALIQVRIHIYSYTYEYICVCVYVYIYVHIYVYIILTLAIYFYV
jgi:hypothetical protein